ncbi:hypothetical protein HYZ41_00325 [archaeon]|nr:hypothetical protein [archaeon]
MQEQKHIEALKEVMETLEQSLKDSRGLCAWQRRLASMLSLGSQHLIEFYFHRMGAMKPGAQLKHEWLKMEEKNLKIRLNGIMTKSASNIKDWNEIFAIAKVIETDRNDLVYGSNMKDDAKLRSKVEHFLDLKKIVEKNTGDIL